MYAAVKCSFLFFYCKLKIRLNSLQNIKLWRKISFMILAFHLLAFLVASWWVLRLWLIQLQVLLHQNNHLLTVKIGHVFSLRKAFEKLCKLQL